MKYVTIIMGKSEHYAGIKKLLKEKTCSKINQLKQRLSGKNKFMARFGNFRDLLQE